MSRRELEVLGVEVTLSIEEAERERGYMINRAEELSLLVLGREGRPTARAVRVARLTQ